MRKVFSDKLFYLMLGMFCITACSHFNENRLIFSKKDALFIESKTTKDDVKKIFGTAMTSFNNLNAQEVYKEIENKIPGSEVKLNEGTYSGWYYQGYKDTIYGDWHLKTIYRRRYYIFDENGILIKKVSSENRIN